MIALHKKRKTKIVSRCRFHNCSVGFIFVRVWIAIAFFAEILLFIWVELLLNCIAYVKTAYLQIGFVNQKWTFIVELCFCPLGTNTDIFNRHRIDRIDDGNQ